MRELKQASVIWRRTQCGVRELKCSTLNVTDMRCRVAPHVGAGVKMMNMTDDGRMGVMSHPSWVRELKWRLHDLWQVRYTAALPHGVRELKDNPTWQ